MSPWVASLRRHDGQESNPPCLSTAFAERRSATVNRSVRAPFSRRLRALSTWSFWPRPRPSPAAFGRRGSSRPPPPPNGENGPHHGRDGPRRDQLQALHAAVLRQGPRSLRPQAGRGDPGARSRPEAHRGAGGEARHDAAATIARGLVPAATCPSAVRGLLTTMLIIAGILLMIVVSWPILKLARSATVSASAYSTCFCRAPPACSCSRSAPFISWISTLTRGSRRTSTKGSRPSPNDPVPHEEGNRRPTQLRDLQASARAESRSDSRVLSDVLQKHPDPDFSFYPFFTRFR